jgi:putative transposase
MSDADAGVTEAEVIDEAIVAPSDDQEFSILNGMEPLPYVLHRRLEVLQRLKGCVDRGEYGREQIKAAQELGISTRSLRRYMLQYRKEGLEGLLRRSRSDQGEVKVSEEWHKFILKSHQEGNRGMRTTSPSQIANLVKSRAKKLGLKSYPSRATIYRVLEAEITERSQKQKSRAIGWQGEQLKITTREGIELEPEYSNQVWQCDHTPADILVVDRHGEILGRPCLTTVIDTYSRCVVGIHLGMELPSAAVTCLALRHAIAPKRYSPTYQLINLWGTYGIPQYLYTDAGPDFTSRHIDQIAASLGITLCLRRKPSDGGIVERPFGTLNSEFFSMLPGYTTRRLEGHRSQVEAEACVTLEDLERLLVRYIVDRYNQLPDPRLGKESRIARWEAGRIVQPPLIGERELDILLMRQDRRCVYQGGYIRFANLVYRGEYLAGYAGQSVVLRYDPRDISTLMVYRQQGAKDVFLTRAHAQHLDTERLSLAEAKAVSRRLRNGSKEISNQSVLEEISDRTRFVENLLNGPPLSSSDRPSQLESPPASVEDEMEQEEPAISKSLPNIQVYDYDQLRQEHGL